MKIFTKIALVLVPAITLSFNVNAHDPKLHAKKTEKADCSKMEHNKMDMKDPVFVAMMKKCMKQDKQHMNNMDHDKTSHHEEKKEKKKAHDHKEGDH